MKGIFNLFVILFFISCNPNYHKKLISLDGILDNKGFYNFPTFKYKGRLVNDLPHGEGELIFKSSDTRILGNFVNGDLEGDAFVSNPQVGEIYGQFKKGDLLFATIFYSNNAVYEGGFKNGKFQGNGIHMDPSGLVSAGKFSNGNLSGIGLRHDSKNNITYQGNFIDDKLDGEVAIRSNGGFQLSNYSKGIDRTQQVLKEQTIEKYLEPQKEDVVLKNQIVQNVQNQFSRVEKEFEKIKQIGTAAAVEEYNKECRCDYKFVKANAENQNVVYIENQWYRFSIDPCIIAWSRDITPEERKAAERRKALKAQNCREWGESFFDPNARSNFEASKRKLEQDRLALQSRIRDQKAAEEKLKLDLARLQTNATRSEQERMRQIQEQIKRERAMEAEKRMEKVNQMCQGKESSNPCCIYWVGARIAQKKPQAVSTQFKNMKVKPEGCFWNLN